MREGYSFILLHNTTQSLIALLHKLCVKCVWGGVLKDLTTLKGCECRTNKNLFYNQMQKESVMLWELLTHDVS